MTLDIYLQWNNDRFRLPVLPEAFELSGHMNNVTVNIHELGEINLKGKRGAYGITISSFFPGQEYSFAREKYHDPYEYYIRKLKNCFEKNKTIHLVITETDINGFFTIEDFTYGNKEKNMDVSYTLALREFRQIQGDLITSPQRISKSASDTSYIWKKGDTWPKITKKVLGSSDNWKEVKKRNRSVIKKARKKYPDKKEKEALVGFKVVIKP